LVLAGLLALLGVWYVASPPSGATGEGAASDPGAGTVRGSTHRHARAADDEDGGRGQDAEAMPEIHELRPAIASSDTVAPQGSFAGRVVNWGSGAGVPEAELTFISEGSSYAVISQDDGRFRFAPANAGTYVLSIITADGYLPYAPELGHSPIVFRPRMGQQVANATVYLRPAVEYLGRVVDRDEQPVAGAQIKMFGATTGDHQLVGVQATYESDQKGEFVFNAPDQALFEASHPEKGYGRARVAGPVQLTHEMTIVLDGAEPGTASIRGKVVDAEGEGLHQVSVRAQAVDLAPQKLGDSLLLEPQTLTDEDGRFELDVDQAKYDLLATRRGLKQGRVEGIESGAADVVIQLTAGASIRGRVVTNDAAPVPAATVFVARPQGKLRRIPVDSVSIFDPKGEFEVTGLEPGQYVLTATAYGHARSQEVPVTLVGGSAENVLIELDDGARLSGKIIDADSREPLKWARVSLEGAGGPGASVLPAVTSTVTDQDGAFELRGIPPGKRGVGAYAIKHHGRLISGLEFVAGQDLGPMTIELRAVEEGEVARTELFGIGVALSPQDDALVVTMVMDGGGAHKAGIVESDAIVAVDGAAVTALGFEGSIQAIRGPDGSTVAIGLRREGGKDQTLTVRRGPIETG
jgi:hypothetical protein